MRGLLAVLVAMMGVACSGPVATVWCVETEAGETRFESKRVTVKHLGAKNDRRGSYIYSFAADTLGLKLGESAPFRLTRIKRPIM